MSDGSYMKDAPKGPGIEVATAPGTIGPKMKGKITNTAEPKGPSIEQGDAMGTPAIKKSAGFKGLMGRLKKGF